MARKNKIKRHHVRRRVSGKGTITDLLLKGVGALGGGVAGAFVVQAIDTAGGASIPKPVAPGGVFVAGLLLTYLVKNNPLALGAGLGMAGVGGAMLVNEMGLSVPGISGLAMSSNSGPQSRVMRTAVGNGPLNNGQGYFRHAVGRHPRRMGALISN